MYLPTLLILGHSTNRACARFAVFVIATVITTHNAYTTYLGIWVGALDYSGTMTIVAAVLVNLVVFVASSVDTGSSEDGCEDECELHS